MAQVAGNNQFTHIASSLGNTLVRQGNGVLHTLVINKLGTAANTLTIYDGTSASGSVIAVIDSTVLLISLTYDIQFVTGLFIVSATGVGADITVTWQS